MEPLFSSLWSHLKCCHMTKWWAHPMCCPLSCGQWQNDLYLHLTHSGNYLLTFHSIMGFYLGQWGNPPQLDFPVLSVHEQFLMLAFVHLQDSPNISVACLNSKMDIFLNGPWNDLLLDSTCAMAAQRFPSCHVCWLISTEDFKQPMLICYQACLPVQRELDFCSC